MNNKKFRIAKVYVHGQFAADFIEENNHYTLQYMTDYSGAAISLTLPVSMIPYNFIEREKKKFNTKKLH